MKCQIEHAVREQIALLESQESTAAQFIHVIARLSGESNDSQSIVSETFARLRLSGNLSDQVVALITPFLSASPAQPNSESLDLISDPDPAASISVGRVLRERYVIEEILGTGSKGTVFKALDRYRSSLPDDQQHVALKVLHSRGDCSEQIIKNLRRELHSGQMLSHRNVVNVFELDRDKDVVFFTMELLYGELLSALIDRMRPSTLQPAQTWQLIRQLGEGLQHAHERGIVHGDLKPRNILVTREGELRILDFGAAKEFVRTQSESGQPAFAPISGTPAYASCEQLEGRAADPRDDLYALACICYELLTGAHPFAHRPSTVARDFGVKAIRPANLSSRQWRALQAALSWHRAGRSMSVHTWIQRLTHGIAEKRVITPLRELKTAAAPIPLWRSRAVAALFGVLLIAGACISQLRETPAQKAVNSASEVNPRASEPALSEGPLPPDAPVLDARAAVTRSAANGIGQANQSARPPPFTISVDGYELSAGGRFVEIRVHRNQLQKNSSFAWWTEPATARQDIDYVNQAKAIQTFPADGRSTRFYVKLLPDSDRLQREYFYVAISQPGQGQNSDKVTRAQIWLPAPDAQLQASR
jgi:serine/threonine protein kinase